MPTAFNRQRHIPTAADCDELLGEFKARLAELGRRAGLDAEPVQCGASPGGSRQPRGKNSHHGGPGEARRGIPGATYFQGVKVLASHC